MKHFSKEFLEKTIKVWQPYSPDPLSFKDAKEIARNMVELLEFLMELDRRYGSGDDY
jgi:hypothetical protein